MSEPVFYFIMQVLTGLALGGIIGSFLTMLSYRLPRKKSLWTPSSSCPSCQKKIAWMDLIPVYSYLTLQGKCRNCGAEFGKRYLVIETVCVVATTIILGVYGLTDKGFMLVFVFAVMYGLYVTLQEQGQVD